MHQIKSIHTLTDTEVRDLAAHAAERGERVEDVNPFTAGTHAHTVFAEAFHEREADLQPAG